MCVYNNNNYSGRGQEFESRIWETWNELRGKRRIVIIKYIVFIYEIIKKQSKMLCCTSEIQFNFVSYIFSLIGIIHNCAF